MSVETLAPNIDTDLLRGYTDDNLDGYVGFDYGIGNLNNSVQNEQISPGEFTAQVNLSPNTNYWIRAKMKNYWDSEWTYGQTWEVPVQQDGRFGGGGKTL
jgi:hypothetical protein